GTAPAPRAPRQLVGRQLAVLVAVEPVERGAARLLGGRGDPEQQHGRDPGRDPTYRASHRSLLSKSVGLECPHAALTGPRETLAPTPRVSTWNSRPESNPLKIRFIFALATPP